MMVARFLAAAVVCALIAGAPFAAAQERPTDAPAAEPVQSLPPADEVKVLEPGQQPSEAQPAPQPGADAAGGEPGRAATAAEPEAGPATSEPAGEPTAPGFSGAQIPHDLSPMGMFMNADWVVKGVMIGLAFASLLTWTIGIAKVLELAGARRKLKTGLSALAASRTLEDARRVLGNRKGAGPVAAFVNAADAELAYSEDALSPEGVKERVASHLSRLEAQAGRKLTIGTGLLATIGSTAPFVGLFGTVWGIMNSFIGISNAQTTNLAVVAPGIAEALLATAIGLVAAIPAVVIYNVFARALSGHRAMLADASAATLRIVSRDLDRLTAPRRSRRAAE